MVTIIPIPAPNIEIPNSTIDTDEKHMKTSVSKILWIIMLNGNNYSHFRY